MSEVNFKVTQKNEAEFNVSLPYFCKYGQSEYKVLSKGECLRADPSGQIEITFASLPFQLGATESTERNFNIAYHKALDVLERKVR